MATNVWETAGAMAPLATVYFVQIVLGSGLRQRHVKSSEVFVKRPYNTESLSDALSATYKFSIESDGLLSSYSYQKLPPFQYVVIATPPTQTKYMIKNVIVLFAAVQAHWSVDQLVSYAEGGNSLRIAALSLLFSISLFMIIIMKGSFKEDDAGCATIPIKWSGEMLVLVVISIFFRKVLLSMLAPMIEVYRIKAIPSILKIVQAIFMAPFCCIYVALLVQIVKTRRHTVPTIEVQLAQAASDKDVENTDILKFDVGKVIRKFANDVAKEFASSGKKWIADSVILVLNWDKWVAAGEVVVDFRLSVSDPEVAAPWMTFHFNSVIAISFLNSNAYVKGLRLL
ncbi:uncharacterized protein V1513DRAFT_481087 [Lipomyces chichibuensis]|uniref:uncharacterized protein n=1 Tax=Lipomyces chichibuensis TaxID=1546026 RepID=UPI003343FD9D